MLHEHRRDSPMLDGNCSTRPPGRTNSTARTNSTDWQRPDPAAISDLYDLGRDVCPHVA